MSISKLTLACTLMLSTLTLALAPVAQAADSAAIKPSRHKVGAKAVPAKPAEPDEDEPDTTGSTIVDFKCELGNQVTIYTNAGDDEHIALRWKNHVHRLVRVSTSTGAKRFENSRYGLVWIGIPAKSMLLDSKESRQLANECKSTEQTQAEVTATQLPQKS